MNIRTLYLVYYYYYYYFHFDILCNYDFVLNRLNFRTLCSRHLDALFLINVFKGKINFPTNINTSYSCAH